MPPSAASDAVSKAVRSVRGLLGPALIALAGGVALAGYGVARFGCVPFALAYLRGERLVVDDASRQLGPVAVGEKRQIRYKLTNLSSTEVRVLGSNSPCACTVVNSMPDSFPAGSSRDVGIEFSPIPEQPRGDYVGVIRLFTDSDVNAQLELKFVGRIISPSTMAANEADFLTAAPRP